MADELTAALNKILPKEAQGDNDSLQIFASVGAALTKWESLQTGLALLFLDATAAQIAWPVLRAFGHSLLVQNKLDMIQFAAEASLGSEPDLFKKVVKYLGSVRGYNDRRNDIAHGEVHYIENEGYFLMPPRSASKKYPEITPYELPEPLYCWTSSQIIRYRLAFERLEEQCAGMRREVRAVTGKLAEIHARRQYGQTPSPSTPSSTGER